MRVGIPKGLLYCKYHPFFKTFFGELGADIVTSGDTNKNIMDMGVKSCVDEACLPIKIYHGHVCSIIDKCDYLVIPRIMSVRRHEYICPKFCGLPEMINHSIQGLPEITFEPLYMQNDSQIYKWCLSAGSVVTGRKSKIKEAFELALKAQKRHSTGINIPGENLTVMLAGHPYIIYDGFLNMGIVKKLRSRKIGIITEEFASKSILESQINKLTKRPFWTFQRNLYGAAAAFYHQQIINGIIYLSSFACGIDSVIVELIRFRVGEFPLLVLKLDEHTGEAGVDTRIEAFIDMLERRSFHENHHTPYGKRLYSSENPV
ncbi:MAG: 2-hydroxyglutaryl-CoA dehydratase [Clostridiaceae bacterium]|jgi:predicted nucleotide-binding protein (sugar kinase/HSP70/actin superfamily)|nr:2-hydroxyglutaryl-CoA dehydratase [Clostridiaceae bacterium]